jgi:hypothetical protein
VPKRSPVDPSDRFLDAKGRAIIIAEQFRTTRTKIYRIFVETSTGQWARTFFFFPQKGPSQSETVPVTVEEVPE